jgi:hypothetical protein
MRANRAMHGMFGMFGNRALACGYSAIVNHAILVAIHIATVNIGATCSQRAAVLAQQHRASPARRSLVIHAPANWRPD